MSVRKLYTIFFALGIFFIPFNQFEGLPFLGEYSDESATYFFLIGLVFLLIESFVIGKISIPYKNSLTLLLFLFIIWTAFSTLINIETVSTSYFKQTSGFNRYIRQSISLIISAVFFTIFFWNVIKNYAVFEIFKFIRKIILYSFLFVSVYGFIEIAIVFFGMGFLKPVLESFEYFPFVNTYYHEGGRIGISSVTFEIPSLGTYLITVFPWMVSYIYTEKKLYKYIPLLFILILLFFSDSRSALIVILSQIAVFTFLLILDSRYRKKTLKILRFGIALVVLATFVKSDQIIKTVEEKADRVDFVNNLTSSVSNQSRFGIQYATLQVFKENPIAGVGLGQVAYHNRYHYPYWATHNNWEFDLKYNNQTVKSFPPLYNLYTRILGELGIIGFLLFGGLIFLTLYYSFLLWKISNDRYRFVGMILLISFVGMSINWLQLDHFKQYGFWLSLVILIKCRTDFKNKKFYNEEAEPDSISNHFS